MTGRELHYSADSYESRVLGFIEEMHTSFSSGTLQYALFGGAGVAAYIGHLPRKIHDVDIVVVPECLSDAENWLLAQLFEYQHSRKATRACFKKFIARRHVYQIVASLFPAKFT